MAKDYRTDNKSFMLYKDWEPMFAMLSDADAGRLVKALFAFARGGELPKLNGKIGMAFLMFSKQIDRDGAKWEETCEKQRARVMKRWEKQRQDTAVSCGIPDCAGDTDTATATETATVTETDSTARIPTLEEVAAYCRERRSRVDPQHFVDHYTANGWMVGRTPMRDWKAAVRRWEQNGIQPQKPQKPQRMPNSSIDLAEAERLINRTL